MAQQEHEDAGLLKWPAWIGLIVEDLDAQRRYYRDIVGLKERRVGQSYSIFEIESRLFELIARSSGPLYAHKGFHIGFTVANIEAARAELISRGLEAVGEIQSEDGNLWCYFKDPEGNLYQITTPSD
ncbi:MAG TPA: VOC family protein [Ktedonobacteraceae bacterium]|jgi:catechol 2,3-dioxygenase-like lactoylglutathione lyase family enzyme